MGGREPTGHRLSDCRAEWVCVFDTRGIRAKLTDVDQEIKASDEANLRQTVSVFICVLTIGYTGCSHGRVITPVIR